MLGQLIDMYNQNSKHKATAPPPMSPRISFSRDFVESSHSQQRAAKHERASTNAPMSSDFEFSVTNYSMSSADELFSKGKMLPFRDSGGKTTLRDELLLVHDDDEGIVASARPPRWKELLGFKKSHVGSKKSAKNAALAAAETHLSISTAPQELLNDDGPGGSDVDFN